MLEQHFYWYAKGNKIKLNDLYRHNFIPLICHLLGTYKKSANYEAIMKLLLGTWMY